MYSLHSIIEEDLDAEHPNYARQSIDMNIKPRRMRSAMTLQQQQPTASSSSSSTSSSRPRAYQSPELVYESGPSLLRFPAPPTSFPASTAQLPSGSSSSQRSSDRVQSSSSRPKAPPRSLTLPTVQGAPVPISTPLVNPPLRTSSSLSRLNREVHSPQLKSCFEDDGEDDDSSSGSESRYKSLFKRAASALKSPKHQPQGGFAVRQQQSLHAVSSHAHKSVSVKDVQVLLPSLNPSTPHASSSFTFPRHSSPGKEKPLPTVPFHHGSSSKAGDLSPTPSLTSSSSCSSSSSTPVTYIRTSTIVPTQSPVSPEEAFEYVDTLSGYFSPSPMTGTFPESQMENPKAPWHHSRADSHDLDRQGLPMQRPQALQHKHSRSGSLSSIASSNGSSFVQTHSRVSSTTSIEERERDAKSQSLERRPGLKSYASSSALSSSPGDDEAARKRIAQRSLLPPSPSPYKRPSTSQGAYLPTMMRAASPSDSASSGHSTVVPSSRSGKDSASSSGSTTPTRITSPAMVPAQPSATIKPKSILKSSKSVPSLQKAGRPATSPSQAMAVPPVPTTFVPFTSPRRSPPPPQQTTLPSSHHHMYQRSRAATVDRR